MGGDELSKPLLPCDQSQVIITVGDEDSCDMGSASDAIAESPYSQLHNQENPYAIIGAGDFALPPTSTIDPFRNHTPNIDGIYEWLKIMIIMPVVLIRLLIFGLCLVIGFVATKIALQGWKDKLNPMPKWRCRIMWVTRICTRCILFSFGYHWIRRKGRPAPREIAPIVVSNHISYIEPIFFFYELFPTIVSSDSHDSIPFVGTIIRAMQVIYVNRFSPASRKNAVNEIKRKASVNRFPRVLLFPEGTTTNGRLLITFQLGAFLPGYPVQPVVIRYPYVHFDQSWGNIALAKLLFRMFTQFHNFMEVEYLPVIFPLEKAKESVTCFANRTSRAIASALNVAQTNYSYVDFMLLGKASDFKQENPSLYLIEMEKQEIKSHISSVEAVDFLETFLSMNPDDSGLVQINNFLKAFRLRACMLSEQIFGFLDMERRGSVSFKHFLFGSVNVLKQPLFRQACELAFAKSTGNHFMSELQFGESIKLAIPDLNDDEIHGLFCLFDTKKEGKIAMEEFSAFLRRNPLLIALFVPLLRRTI